jgi:hypothetical protein
MAISGRAGARRGSNHKNLTRRLGIALAGYLAAGQLTISGFHRLHRA